MSNNPVRKRTRKPITVDVIKNEVEESNGGLFPFAKPSEEYLRLLDPLKSKLQQLVESIEEVPINVKSIINRDTCDTNLKKILSNAGGFDFTMWNPPLVGRLPDGTQYLYDGDHSRALYKMANPGEDTMPCRIKYFDSVEEIHREFVKVNSSCITTLSKEEIFVHEVHGKVPEAVEMCKKVEEIGCSVYCSHEPGGIVGNIDGPSVGVVTLKKVLSFTGDDLIYAAKAVDTINEASKRDSHDLSFRFPNELLGGLTQLYVSIKGLSDSMAFRDWFKGRIGMQSLKSFASDAKILGGNVHNHADYSAARGMLQMFREAVADEYVKDYIGKVPTANALKKFSPEYKKKQKKIAKRKAAKKKSVKR